MGAFVQRLPGMRPTIFTWNAPLLIRLAAAVIASVTLLWPSPATSAEYNPALTRPRLAQADAIERVIVKFRPASRLQAQAAAGGEAAAAAADGARVNSLARRMRLTLHASRALGGDMHVLNVSPQAGGETAAATLARLRADSEVEYAVPDRRVYPSAVSNDPRATGQWYLGSAQLAAIRAQEAWDTTVGRRGVVVAVLDTGVLFDHPDLGRMNAGGRLLPGYDFISASPGNPLDLTTANDNNGRDSDPSDPGDWVAATDGCGAATNSSWHGTRVSGIISALSNNGVGVAGVMWNSTILPVRVLGKCGGFNSDVMEGMRWAAGLHVPGVPDNPNPARVINLSLGSEGACDTFSRDVISQVTATGALVVVAAGNEGGPVDSPANCAGAMAVLGLRHIGTKVGFSSLGPEIALGAPGGNCVNTAAGAPCLFSIDTTANLGTTVPGTHTYTDQLNYNVGTSFSAPIVSGIAGLMLSVNGNLKSAQLIGRMRASALPYPTTSTTDPAPPACHAPAFVGDIQQTECICNTAACGSGMANASGAVIEALRPIAAISAPATFTPNSTVVLEASGSAAACDRTVTSYAWSVLSGQGTVTSSNMAVTSIQAPASGTTVIQLVVTDDAGRTDTATITLATTSTTTTAPATAGTTACISDQPLVTVAANDSSASEAGADTGAFTITRSGGTDNAVTVAIGFSGSAVSGVDYVALPGSVVIPAGQRSVLISLAPINDSVVEGNETVILVVQAGAGYDVGAPASASVGIADNDQTTSSGNTGGGSLDLLTLFAGLAAVAQLVLRRRQWPASSSSR
jgi:serine protease